MSGTRAWSRFDLLPLAGLLVGVVGCAIGGAIDGAAFYRAWLCAFLFWLGLPLAGVALVMVHDLTGGQWMASARPALDAAIATMPLATLAGIPAILGLPVLYGWTQTPHLANAFYLNSGDFVLRYAVDLVLWNLLAAYALWAPRAGGLPIAPFLSWLSGVGLALLAVSAGFAAVDWMLSLEPTFWSSIFPMIAGASWFNTGLALVLLVVALAVPRFGLPREHLADLAAILLATTIFWAYVEFCQFLIIWEENLKSEIQWYLRRAAGAWAFALEASVALGFVVPFLVLLWRPSKHRPRLVAAICCLILLGRIVDKWWLVLPEFVPSGPFWLDVAAMLALGGGMLLLFLSVLRRGAPGRMRVWQGHHG